MEKEIPQRHGCGFVRSQYLEILRCVILIGRFLQCGYPQLYGLLTKVDLNNVAELYLVRGARRFAVYHHSLGIAGFIRNGAALYKSGYFSVFVQLHRDLLAKEPAHQHRLRNS